MSQTEYAEYKRTSHVLNQNNILPPILDSHNLTLYTRYALEMQRVALNTMPAFLPASDCSGVGFLPCPPGKSLPNRIPITAQLPVTTRHYSKSADGKVDGYPAYLNRVKSLNYKGLWVNHPLCNSIPNAKYASYFGFNSRVNTKTFMELTSVCK